MKPLILLGGIVVATEVPKPGVVGSIPTGGTFQNIH